MCVCSVFCCVALFVVGWQQHCRYIVIDAMVYPKSCKSEDKFGTGKTLKSLSWVWYSYIWLRVFVLTTIYVMKIVMTGVTWVLLSSLNGGILNLDLTTLCMSRTRWVLDDLPSSIFCFRRRVLLWLPFWSRMWSGPEIFSNPLPTLDWNGIEHPYIVVRWDDMSKGGMKVEHPMGEGD